MNMSPSRTGRPAAAMCRMSAPTGGASWVTWKPIVANSPSGRYRPVKKSVASVTVGEPDTLCSAIRISSVMASSLLRTTS